MGMKQRMRLILAACGGRARRTRRDDASGGGARVMAWAAKRAGVCCRGMRVDGVRRL
jgi:hypothetical protein